VFSPPDRSVHYSKQEEKETMFGRMVFVVGMSMFSLMDSNKGYEKPVEVEIVVEYVTRWCLVNLVGGEETVLMAQVGDEEPVVISVIEKCKAL
jgi:hypothetical protein